MTGSAVVVHGYVAYNKGACRCDVCRSANTEHMRRWRRLSAKTPLPFALELRGDVADLAQVGVSISRSFRESA